MYIHLIHPYSFTSYLHHSIILSPSHQFRSSTIYTSTASAQLIPSYNIHTHTSSPAPMYTDQCCPLLHIEKIWTSPPHANTPCVGEKGRHKRQL